MLTAEIKEVERTGKFIVESAPFEYASKEEAIEYIKKGIELKAFKLTVKDRPDYVNTRQIQMSTDKGDIKPSLFINADDADTSRVLILFGALLTEAGHKVGL